MQAPDDFDPPIGVAETLAPGLRRIVAPNPSPMTYRGTNTYLLGTDEIAVIDPGPEIDAHLESILAAVGPGARISHILVTHTHLDHSPLSRALSERTGAPIWGYGDTHAGRSAVMRRLAATGMLGGGESPDLAFRPDHLIADGDVIEGADWQLTALWTPGHYGNHLCFRFGDAVLTGDLVMGWATSLVSPPDGDLTDFMASCEKLQALGARVFFPGHGAPVTEPQARLDWLLDHRRGREAQILSALAEQADTAEGLARRIYTDTPPALLPAATRNVLAHLIDLVGKNAVSPIGELAADARFERVGQG
ncbi:MBL fold metallo-hydrolase [Thalassovita sp.]|uniref:MBL fold metallo-hydrolase n=1 Tax=Thalassovita sp. TaxID=1979401 RepID=UPI002B270B9F|nr:MBL fold metallo-hydrolase [Thalassovita sp.]